MAESGCLKLIAAGDVMLGDSSHFLGRGVGSLIARHGADYPFTAVAGQLARADLFLANLESPLADHPGRNAWEKVYRGAASSAAGLRRAERNVVTLANNHILEHGSALLAETRAALDAAGIGHVGFASDGSHDGAVLRWRQNDLEFVLLADSTIPEFSRCPRGTGLTENWLLEQLAEQTADVRIVSLHWGDEYVTTPSPEQIRLGRRLIEAGATLVLGHHPHVLQPVERVGSGLIAYSLGNFVFDQDWSPATRRGGLLEIELEAGGVRDWSFTPTVLDRRCRPESAQGIDAEAARKIVERPVASEPERYGALLADGLRRHRVAMKTELLRNWFRVKKDTLYFLATRRRRPRPQIEG